MERGDAVKLIGRTLKGKNRVQEGGTLWLVECVEEGMVFIRSVLDEKKFRWVEPGHDHDFDVKVVGRFDDK